MSATHEDYTRELSRKGPSDRNFGVVFTAAFLVFGLTPLRHGKPVRVWCLAASVAILLITLIRPSLLHFANRLWMQLGLLLGRVVNPVVTALLFFVVFTPIGVIRRWMGKDSMGLSFDRKADTYWIDRSAWQERSDLNNQF